MQPLKIATAEKHKIAENMPFNVKMFQGKLSKAEYLNYLIQELELFRTIESIGIPHLDLARTSALIYDIQELSSQGISLPTILKSTEKYSSYLKTLNPESILPHVYLNYLAVMFGGQFIKNKVPSGGKFYQFQNITDAMHSIRNVQSDLWAEEVNRGFDFIIAIFAELELPLEIEDKSHFIQATLRR